MSAELISKLKALKERAEKFNTELHKLQGQKTGLLDRLSTEFNSKTVESAKQLLETYKTEVNKTTTDIVEVSELLEKQLDAIKK